MTAITVSQVVSATITKGQVLEYAITMPSAAKYVVEMGGTASVLFGIWEGSVAPGNGDLRVCGVARRGVRMLAADAHIIQVTGKTAGPFTMNVRPWTFLDYFTINFYKSTC
jgi:hypothetical protein